MNAYLYGTHVLGAEAGAAGGGGLFIHVKNIPQVVARQAGAAGAFANALAPATVAEKFYIEMRKKILEDFSKPENGLDAEITIASGPGGASVSGMRDLALGLALGILAGVGLIFVFGDMGAR